MSLTKVKNRARALEEILPGEISAMREKFSEFSDRKKASKRGKDLKLDIHLCENLLAAVMDFNGSIEHLTREEEE